MKQLSAFLVVLIGIVLMPQHAWSQGASVINGLELRGSLLDIYFNDGINTGTLQPASLTGQTWTLPSVGGTIITTGNASALNGLVSVSVNAPLTGDGTTGSPLGIAVDGSTIQVSGGQLTVGTIPVSKLAVAANNLIVGDGSGQGSLLAPGSTGDVLTISGGGVPIWSNISALEMDPVWTADKAGATTISGTWTFSNTINGSISGNAGTATALQTAQNFALSGDVTAPAVSFDGTAGVTLSTTIANDAVTSAKILDGTIVDDDIATGANIAVSKLAPGSDGQVLTIVSGVPTWTNPSASGGWAVGGNAFSGTNSTQVLGTTTDDHLQIQTGGANTIFFNTKTNTSGDTVEMRLLPDGQLVFYTPTSNTTPNYRIDLPPSGLNQVGRIRCGGISFWSSMRWKEDIRPIPNALEKALALRGVNYRWKPEYGGSDDIGFIMEEVASVVPEVVQRDERTGELHGMDYARLTALLVEALKEEHRRNEELRAELAQLRQLVERVAMQQGITSGASSINVRVDGDWLGQNVPNPHDGTTSIPCYVPAGVSKAELVVSDGAGQLIRSVTLSARNTWTNVTLDMTLLASGTYEYRLVFDGRTVAIKQMQLVR